MPSTLTWCAVVGVNSPRVESGMAGAIGGMLIATATGWILQLTGSYFVPFVLAGCTYLVALGVIQVLVPRLDPAPIGEGAKP
jgi:ACS family hexuronate transporter-like MFS transporter